MFTIKCQWCTFTFMLMLGVTDYINFWSHFNSVLNFNWNHLFFLFRNIPWILPTTLFRSSPLLLLLFFTSHFWIQLNAWNPQQKLNELEPSRLAFIRSCWACVCAMPTKLFARNAEIQQKKYSIARSLTLASIFLWAILFLVPNENITFSVNIQWFTESIFVHCVNEWLPFFSLALRLFSCRRQIIYGTFCWSKWEKKTKELAINWSRQLTILELHARLTAHITIYSKVHIFTSLAQSKHSLQIQIKKQNHRLNNYAHYSVDFTLTLTLMFMSSLSQFSFSDRLRVDSFFFFGVSFIRIFGGEWRMRQFIDRK